MDSWQLVCSAIPANDWHLAFELTELTAHWLFVLFCFSAAAVIYDDHWSDLITKAQVDQAGDEKTKNFCGLYIALCNKAQLIRRHFVVVVVVVFSLKF